MAETVKKSRIVSEDDLEGSLMEEFNMRLKTCMSSDNLNDENVEVKTDSPEENLYENVEIIRTNGRTEFNVLQEEEPHIPENNSLNSKNRFNSIEEFLEIERECLILEQNGLTNNNDVDKQIELVDETNDEIVKEDLLNVEQLEETADVHSEITHEVAEIAADSTKEVSILNETERASVDVDYIEIQPEIQIYSSDVDIVETTNDVEEQASPTENIDINEIADSPSPSGKSVKDRMFLSTESASCLLFTQTVTSPMLTPSEEHVDFIKGFQTASAQQALSDAFEESPNSKVELQNNEPVIDIPNNEEVETTVDYFSSRINEDAYHDDLPVEFADDDEPNEHVFDEPNEHMDLDIKSVDLLKNVPENCENGFTNHKQKYMETITKESNKETPLLKVTECKIPSVKSLKNQYIRTATSDVTKPSSLEKSEITTLKSLDIMKQINKFEQISPGNEDTNTSSDTSTQTTETTYVETTTMETKCSGGQEKVLKKKKSKKSRSHEKENISVNNCIDAIEENIYNVNVRNLRRSFGDLSIIDQESGSVLLKTNKSDPKTKSMIDMRMVGCNKPIENVFNGVSVKALKSSFSKFDALQKKNVLHIRSSDSSKAQEKFNGNQIDNTNCKSCGKIVFQMEQMKAEKSIWHKNCFRCTECKKQLTVDTYQSNEGNLYCKPHFKALFAPKVVEDDAPAKPRKHEMIIRENQPLELPPDVVRASDKPDLGLEELQSLNVKERFQVFEHHEEESNQLDRSPSGINVKRSASILSKLARFQAKGMDIGVSDDSLNGIPIEESTSDEEEEQDGIDEDDVDLIRAKRAQKEKPFHFVGMSDVKSKWEQGDQSGRDERREERKQEIQSIRNRLFMGKQGKMKEAYQQAVMESETGVNVKKTETIESTDTRSLKERFEKGDVQADNKDRADNEDMSVFESGISKKSRSLFLELDANASKSPALSPLSPGKGTEVRKSKEIYLARQASEGVVKSTETVEDVTVQTADIQQRFKFFETYKEPEKERKQFRFTPPREGQAKTHSPDREYYRDPEVVRSEDYVEDSVVAKQTQTAKKMLNKFRQMEEDLSKDQVPLGPKPLKRFTPPPEPLRSKSNSESEDEATDSNVESEEEEEDTVDNLKLIDEELLEAQKAARAKHLRAKFEKWEANEIKREENASTVNLATEFGDDQSQIESTKSLRARFESMQETTREETKSNRVKVNRFV